VNLKSDLGDARELTAVERGVNRTEVFEQRLGVHAV